MIWWGRSNGGENILGPFIIQLIFFFYNNNFWNFSLLLLVLPTILQEHILGDWKLGLDPGMGIGMGIGMDLRLGLDLRSMFKVYVWV